MSFGNERVPSVLYFLHVPRCGGTSVASNIFGRRWYSGNASMTLTREGDDAYKRIKPPLRPAIEFVHGHFAFGIHRLLPTGYIARPGERFTYATILRDPAERVLSWYRHARAHKHLGLSHDLAANGDVRDVTLRGQHRYYDNLAVRMLQGPHDYRSIGDVRPADLERAKRNLLEHFRVVGVLENYGQFIRDVRIAFGRENLPLPEEDSTWHPRHNVNKLPPGPEETDALKAQIRDRNRYDVALYNWVKEQWSL